MIKHNNDKSNNFPKKKFFQSLIIIFIIVVSIYILFYNVSHNFPNEFTNQTYLSWYIPQIIISFGIAYIALLLCTLLILNIKNSSLREFFSVKNIILSILIVMSISIVNYCISLMGNTISFIQNLNTDFELISVLFIILFIFIGIVFLTILHSINKK